MYTLTAYWHLVKQVPFEDRYTYQNASCSCSSGSMFLAEQQPKLRGDHQVVPGLEVHVLRCCAGPPTGQGEVQ